MPKPKPLFCGLCTWREQLKVEFADTCILLDGRFQKFPVQQRFIHRKKRFGVWCPRCKLYVWQAIKLTEVLNVGDFQDLRKYAAEISSWELYTDYQKTNLATRRQIATDYFLSQQEKVTILHPDPRRFEIL